MGLGAELGAEAVAPKAQTNPKAIAIGPNTVKKQSKRTGLALRQTQLAPRTGEAEPAARLGAELGAEAGTPTALESLEMTMQSVPRERGRERGRGQQCGRCGRCGRYGGLLPEGEGRERPRAASASVLGLTQKGRTHQKNRSQGSQFLTYTYDFFPLMAFMTKLWFGI